MGSLACGAPQALLPLPEGAGIAGGCPRAVPGPSPRSEEASF